MTQPSPTQPAIEPLEERRLLSASLVGSQLRISGTSGNDNIVVKLKRGSDPLIQVNDNGNLKSFVRSSVNSILIYTSGGNDLVYIDERNGDLTQNATLSGGAGDDRLIAGSGSDSVDGDSGNDKIYGNDGSDSLDGDSGNDWLFGGFGNDSLDGDANDDYLDGGAGDDDADGDLGNDRVYGNQGNDTVDGDEGIDYVHGGSGNDSVDGDLGIDTVWGGSGADVFDSDDTSNERRDFNNSEGDSED